MNKSHFPKAPRRLHARGAFVLSILDHFQGVSGPYNFKKDTSHLLLQSLRARGHRIFYTTPESLFFHRGRVQVRASPVTVLPHEPYFTFDGEETLPLERFPLVFMRKDPPVDLPYLHATHLLSLVSKEVLIINDPQALRDWNEKLVILNFPRLIPRTLISSDKQEIDRFVRSEKGVAVVKPLEGFAGRGVRKLQRGSDDEASLLDELTGSGPVMVQQYLPQVSEGEKRVFMIDGRPLGALLKTPPAGGFLTNPDLGGSLAPTGLTAREKRICATLSPFLKRNRIFFAGVDLIGERLTEINITSPGLVWEWNEVDNRRHEEEIVDRIERKLR